MSCYDIIMYIRMVRNGKETDSFLKKESASLFYKDLKKYTEDQKKVIESALIQSTKFGLKSIMKQWLTKSIIDFDVNLLKIKEDYLPVLISFQSNEDDLNKIFDFHSINEVIRHIELNYGSEKKIVPLSEMNIFFELDGRFISMPMTERASIFLGKDTVWCTAYTASENMFRSYVTDNTILFYIISTKANPRKNSEDKICVGYENGKIVYGGSKTVDSANNEISKERLDKILGNNVEKFKTAMSAMVSKYKKMHPIQLRAVELAKSARKFSKKVDEVGAKEAMELIGNNPISDSVLRVFLNSLESDSELEETMEYLNGYFSIDEIFKHTADEFIKAIFLNLFLSKKFVSPENVSTLSILLKNCPIKEDIQKQVVSILISEMHSMRQIRPDVYYDALNAFFYNEQCSEEIKIDLLTGSLLSPSKKDSFVEHMSYNYLLKETEIFDTILNFDFIRKHTSEVIIATCNLRKNTMNKIISSGNVSSIENLARNSSISKYEDIVERLFNFSESVRKNLALNSGLKAEYQIRLLHDKSKDVAIAKASNINNKKMIEYFMSRKELTENDELLKALFRNIYMDIDDRLLENRRYLLFIAECYSYLFERVAIENGLVIDLLTRKTPLIFNYIWDEEVIEKLVANTSLRLEPIAVFLSDNDYYLSYFIRLLDSKQIDAVFDTIINFGTEKHIIMCIERHDKPRNLVLGFNEMYYYKILDKHPDIKKYLEAAVL